MKLAFATLLALPVVAVAAPTGHLAYIQNNVAKVTNAATGTARILPKSARAQFLAVSPRGEVVYFTAPPGKKANPDGPASLTGYFSAPPYSAVRKLPDQLQGEAPGNLRWSRTGSTLWIDGFEFFGAYTPATNNWKKLAQFPESVSSDGQLIAFQTNNEIRVREVNSGKEQVIFSSKKPQVLFDAIKLGKNQKLLKDLSDEISPDLWKDDSNWAISSPALLPDGSRLLFASNAGTGQGAAGNSTWALFSADLKSGKIAVLSKVGTQFGRMPDSFEVSPDGKRLLCLVSQHSSAIDNPSYALVIDLLTQDSREVLDNLPESKDKSNLTYGACWSPDGKYVAISAYFYDLAKANAFALQANGWDGPPDSAYTIYIKDARTARTVRRIAGAHSPSWSQ